MQFNNLFLIPCTGCHRKTVPQVFVNNISTSETLFLNKGWGAVGSRTVRIEDKIWKQTENRTDKEYTDEKQAGEGSSKA